MYKSLFLLWSNRQGWNVFKRNFTRKLNEKQNPGKEEQSERKGVNPQSWFLLLGHGPPAQTGQIRLVWGAQGPQALPALASQSRVASRRAAGIWGIITPFQDPSQLALPEGVFLWSWSRSASGVNPSACGFCPRPFPPHEKDAASCSPGFLRPRPRTSCSTGWFSAVWAESCLGLWWRERLCLF